MSGELRESFTASARTNTLLIYIVALSRYEAIIETPESGLIDYDSVESTTTKPTAAAIRVNDLLETITERYRPLLSFQQKIRFLLDIQLSIFNRFHARLTDGLEAYLTMTSTVGRSISSIGREDQDELKGVKGLDRLCRVYGSADYLEHAMRDWSDDVFFLEMWDELQDRAKAHSNKNVAGDLTVQDVSQRTSSAVGKTEDTGALFDETANAYRQLRVRAEGIIVEALTRSIKEALKPYSRINPWSALSVPSVMSGSSNPPSLGPNTTTPELEPLVSVLKSQLPFLARTLGPAPLRRIVRQACLGAQTYVWDNVLTRYAFSGAGATQLRNDIMAITAIVNRWTGPGQGEANFKKIIEGVTILALPIKGRSKSNSGQTAAAKVSEVSGEDDAWDDVEVSVDADEGFHSGSDGIMGLWEAERRIFADDESATETLEELGLNMLTEAEARSVLKRRVELNS